MFPDLEAMGEISAGENSEFGESLVNNEVQSNYFFFLYQGVATLKHPLEKLQLLSCVIILMQEN